MPVHPPHGGVLLTLSHPYDPETEFLLQKNQAQSQARAAKAPAFRPTPSAVHPIQAAPHREYGEVQELLSGRSRQEQKAVTCLLRVNLNGNMQYGYPDYSLGKLAGKIVRIGVVLFRKTAHSSSNHSHCHKKATQINQRQCTRYTKKPYAESAFNLGSGYQGQRKSLTPIRANGIDNAYTGFRHQPTLRTLPK